MGDFVVKTLRPDGVMLLRMIQGNGGDLLTGELTLALFRNWQQRKREENKNRALEQDAPLLPKDESLRRRLPYASAH